MSNLFKKALGAFVEFDEAKQKAAAHGPDATEQAEPAASPAVDLEPVADLSQDPDVVRVTEAIGLLSSLPLAEIPAAKARELIVRTLKFAGLDAGDLSRSFARAQALYTEQIQVEERAIAGRREQNLERLKLLEQAIAEEKQQCAAEVSERSARIDRATTQLVEIEKAMVFFTPNE